MHNRNSDNMSVTGDTNETKGFFYILEIYPSTTDTKEELSKHLGLRAYQ